MHAGLPPVDSQHDIGGSQTLVPHWTPVAPWSPPEDEEELELVALELVVPELVPLELVALELVALELATPELVAPEPLELPFSGGSDELARHAPTRDAEPMVAKRAE